jgi:hypothetical protein
MKLPKYEQAIISEAKITQYLLSRTHHEGRGKANFFLRLGFTVEHWQELALVLKRHATDNEVSKVESSPFGTRYVIEGTFHTPGNRTVTLRSIWFIGSGEEIPRFVTAYPRPRSTK